MGPEAKIKKKVLAWIKKEHPGAWHYAPVQHGMGQSGIPDRICCIPFVVTPDMVGTKVGLFIAIEVKAKGQKPTPLQKDQLSNIQRAGGVSLVAIGTDEGFDMFRFVDDFNDPVF